MEELSLKHILQADREALLLAEAAAQERRSLFEADVPHMLGMVAVKFSDLGESIIETLEAAKKIKPTIDLLPLIPGRAYIARFVKESESGPSELVSVVGIYGLDMTLRSVTITCGGMPVPLRLRHEEFNDLPSVQAAQAQIDHTGEWLIDLQTESPIVDRSIDDVSDGVANSAPSVSRRSGFMNVVAALRNRFPRLKS